jgi:hypothetical protein
MEQEMSKKGSRYLFSDPRIGDVQPQMAYIWVDREMGSGW